MSPVELLSLIVTFVCVVSFSIVFTVLFKNHYKAMINDIKEGKNDIELIDNALYEEKLAKSKAHKTFVIITKVISSVFLGVVIIGFGFSLFSRITGNLMPIGNSTFVVVSTGSMSKKNSENDYLLDYGLNNQIQTYDMVNIQKVKNVNDIKVYDVIAFKATDGRVIVHRVIKITNNGFVTKGDNNKDSDVGVLYGNALSFSEVVGKYNGFRIPLVGLFVIFLQSNAGIITIISIFYCIIMFEHLRGKYENAIIERTNLLIDLIEFDLEKETSNGVQTSFKEILIYKGQEYHFVSGKFVHKEVNNDKYGEDEMVFVKDKDDQIETKVKKVETK